MALVAHYDLELN
jgi:hypothetical protein